MFGYPNEIISDNGSQFVSEETEKYLKDHNIKHRCTSPFWPSANGEVERFNRTLGKMIKCYTAEGKDWHEWLNTFLLDYRSTLHRATGHSPTNLIFTYKRRNNIPQIEY